MNLVEAELKKIAASKSEVSKFLIHLTCLKFNIDLIIINAREPVEIFRPRADAQSDPEMLALYDKHWHSPKLCFVLRYIQGRPRCYGPENSTDELEKQLAHFALLIDKDKKIPPFSVSLDMKKLSELQKYPEGRQLVSEFPSEEHAKKFFYSTGAERESMNRKAPSVDVDPAWQYFNGGKDEKKVCKLCAEKGKLKSYKHNTGISNLKHHLKNEHSLTLIKVKDTESESKQEEPGQGIIISHTTQRPPLVDNMDIILKATNDIIEYCAEYHNDTGKKRCYSIRDHRAHSWVMQYIFNFLKTWM